MCSIEKTSLGLGPFSDHTEGLPLLTLITLFTTLMIEALTSPIVIDGYECHVSCSGGIAVYPGDGNNAVEPIKNADIAMYHVKARGRNGFELFSQIKTEQL